MFERVHGKASRVVFVAFREFAAFRSGQKQHVSKKQVEEGDTVSKSK